VQLFSSPVTGIFKPQGLTGIHLPVNVSVRELCDY